MECHTETDGRCMRGIPACQNLVDFKRQVYVRVYFVNELRLCFHVIFKRPCTDKVLHLAIHDREVVLIIVFGNASHTVQSPE